MEDRGEQDGGEEPSVAAALACRPRRALVVRFGEVRLRCHCQAILRLLRIGESKCGCGSLGSQDSAECQVEVSRASSLVGCVVDSSADIGVLLTIILLQLLRSGDRKRDDR